MISCNKICAFNLTYSRINKIIVSNAWIVEWLRVESGEPGSIPSPSIKETTNQKDEKFSCTTLCFSRVKRLMETKWPRYWSAICRPCCYDCCWLLIVVMIVGWMGKVQGLQLYNIPSHASRSICDLYLSSMLGYWALIWVNLNN